MHQDFSDILAANCEVIAKISFVVLVLSVLKKRTPKSQFLESISLKSGSVRFGTGSVIWFGRSLSFNSKKYVSVQKRFRTAMKDER